MSWSLLGHRPDRFSCFGEPVHAVASGVVVAVADRQRDQRARNSWPALLWFSTVENILRSVGGVWAIIGNRVIIRHDDGGGFTAYAHLKRGSVTVRVGERVEAGQMIAEVGNTGNTTQPHLHIQLMDRPGFEEAAGIPMMWRGIELEGIDPAWQKYAKEPTPSALSAMPRNGQVFSA